MAAQISSSVAVIVRTKDRPRFLRRALADIFDQTYRQFQITVVNDGGAREQVDEVVAALPAGLQGKVTVVHHETNRGMEAASNDGIRRSEGTYIAIHDDDDLWHPEFLERTVGYLDGSSNAAVAVRTNIRYEELIGADFQETRSEPFWQDMQQISLGEMLRINRAVPISFLYRRSLHKEIGYYDENLEVCGDWEFYLRVLAVHAVGFLDGEPLAYWCQRPAASGADANSVFEKAREHQRFDRQIRDDYLRKDLADGGLGVLLHMSQLMAEQEQLLRENRRAMDQMQDQFNRALTRLEETVTHRTSLSSVFRRGKAAAALLRTAVLGAKR